MFGEPVFSASRHVRAGAPQLFSELVATFGSSSMPVVLAGDFNSNAEVGPDDTPAVPDILAAGYSDAWRVFNPPSTGFTWPLYLAAAYWFTASTSFANPAVTLARAATDTFAGIRPQDAPGFIVVQLFGAAAATALFRWLVPALPDVATEVVVPHAAHPEDA